MNKKIKILFTIPNFDTAGSGRVVVDFVKGMDKSKFEPHICCTHNKGAYFKVVESLGVPVYIVPFFTAYRPFLTLLPRIWKISRFFKKNKFDVIHSWHWSSDFTEPLAAKIAGVPFIYTKKAMGWGNKAWHWRTQLSTKVIAINKDMVNGILKEYAAKVIYSPLGVDTTVFKPLERLRMTPLGHQFKEDDFVIVSIANLAPVKGIECLLEAVMQLKNPGIKVLIVGDNQNEYGKNLILSYRRPEVIFIDKQVDVKPYLAVADLFVIPTKNQGRKEGLPIAPLEAMASGRVVLGSDIPGIRDILESKKECLFHPENTQELAQKIEGIIGMPLKNKNKLTLDMREIILRNFSLNKSVKAHENIYINLIKTA